MPGALQTVQTTPPGQLGKRQITPSRLALSTHSTSQSQPLEKLFLFYAYSANCLTFSPPRSAPARRDPGGIFSGASGRAGCSPFLLPLVDPLTGQEAKDQHIYLQAYICLKILTGGLVSPSSDLVLLPSASAKSREADLPFCVCMCVITRFPTSKSQSPLSLSSSARIANFS